MLALWIVLGVIVVLVIMLPFAKRREARLGHRNSSIRDARAAIRAGKSEKVRLTLSRRNHDRR